MTAPFLIMHGGADPTVDFHNGLGFYNALRYNGKTAVLLSYPGEGHGLRGHGEPEGPDDPVLRILRPLPQGRAGAEVDDGGSCSPF